MFIWQDYLKQIKKDMKVLESKKKAPTHEELIRMTGEEKLQRTNFFVEADSYSLHSLWKANFYSNEKPDKLVWIQDHSGFSRVIGHINKNKNMPVCVNFSFYIIGDKYICFYWPTSRYVDWDMVNDWIDKNYHRTYDGGTRIARDDANNFHNCLHFCQGE